MKVIGVVLAVCGLAFATSATAQQQEVASLPAAPTSTLPGSVQTPSDYRLNAQDVVNVDVFGVPELSQTLAVDANGFISMPLIGRVPAGGRTMTELSQEITRKLQQTYMKHPIVTISLKDAASQKVTVDGAVTQPGVYQISENATLLQAVALAHGADNVADTHHVAIVRMGAAGRTAAVYDLDAIREGKAVDPPVQANDVIVVDSSGSKTFIRDFGSIFPLASLFRF